MPSKASRPGKMSFNVMLPQGLYVAIANAADANGCPKADIIRDAICLHLGVDTDGRPTGYTIAKP